MRLITATNRDLQSYIAEGKFRSDLYYRINVVNLNLIPLRERREDIPVLAEAFIKRYAKENGVRVLGLDPEALYAMMNYDWPGNIRELRNTIERCVITSEGGSISLSQLPAGISAIAGQPQRQIEPGAEEQEAGSFSSRYMKHRREMVLSMMEEIRRQQEPGGQAHGHLALHALQDTQRGRGEVKTGAYPGAKAPGFFIPFNAAEGGEKIFRRLVKKLARFLQYIFCESGNRPERAFKNIT